MMLEISKDFFRGDPNKTLDTDVEGSFLSAQHCPGCQCEGLSCRQRPGSTRLADAWSGTRLAVPKAGMRISQSAGSLHSGRSSGSHPYVLRGAGFSWPGRHLGPDQEGPVKVK